ncbi:MAG: pilus assembly PilX N-terminal domain-containing protein [Candidatus Paceibacterota bacterium]
MPMLYTTQKNKEAGSTTTSEGQNESLLSFFPNAVGAKPATANKEAGFTRTLEASSVSSQGERGFTLLLAVIITSVVILLGITIAGILQREALISVSSQASTQAFYAADTALECVMYYDQAHDMFATSTPISDIEDDIDNNLSCIGVLGSNAKAEGDDYGDPYERSFLLDGEGICAGVRMEKRLVDTEERTFVWARGRNTCDSDALNRAERALRTAYEN